MKKFMSLFGLELMTSEFFIKKFSVARIFDEAIWSNPDFSSMLFYLKNNYNLKLNIEFFSVESINNDHFHNKINSLMDLKHEIDFFEIVKSGMNDEKYRYLSSIRYEWLIYSCDKRLVIYGHREHEMGLFLTNIDLNNYFWEKFETVFWPNEVIEEAVKMRNISPLALDVVKTIEK